MGWLGWCDIAERPPRRRVAQPLSPADRFLCLGRPEPPSATDATGYLADASGASVRAVGALAEWLLRPEDVGKAGMGIINVQYDLLQLRDDLPLHEGGHRNA